MAAVLPPWARWSRYDLLRLDGAGPLWFGTAETMQRFRNGRENHFEVWASAVGFSLAEEVFPRPASQAFIAAAFRSPPAYARYELLFVARRSLVGSVFSRQLRSWVREWRVPFWLKTRGATCPSSFRSDNQRESGLEEPQGSFYEIIRCREALVHQVYKARNKTKTAASRNTTPIIKCANF
jgi:hypothetical protein